MIYSMISKTIKSMITTVINPFDGLISRYFLNLDPVLNSYYEIATTITFTGDFEVEVDAYEPIANYGGVISGSNFELLTRADGSLEKMSVLVGGASMSIESAFSRTVFNNLKITRTGSTTTIVTSLGTFDVSAVFGSVTVNIDAIGKNTSGIGGPDLFNGIIANAKFTDKSGASDVVTTFKLDQATANTESSIEGNNSVTYKNIPQSARELYTLDGTTWTDAAGNTIEVAS